MNARSMFCGWPNAEKSFCVVQVKYPYCCDMITVDLFLQKWVNNVYFYQDPGERIDQFFKTEKIWVSRAGILL